MLASVTSDSTPATVATPEDRFRAIVAAVQAPLLRFLLRRTDPETAADVLGDTLLVLWRRLPDVPGDDPLPWSYAVARGALANATRSARRQRHLIARIVLLDPPKDTPGPEPTGDAALNAALAALTEAERELIRLWAWEELAPREIAAVLDLTPNAVSIRLHRAKAKLRASLESAPPQGTSDPAERAGDAVDRKGE